MLDRHFFEQESVLVAEQLIGKVLSYSTPKGTLTGIINETEAYTEEDPACHAFQGKRTKRNQIMFAKAGHIYIYFIYGMYYCINIVTEREGRGCAVLIRSVIPLENSDLMRDNRGPKVTEKNIANGPGKLVLAYGIPSTLNGTSLFDKECPLHILDQGNAPKKIDKSPRIGIRKGQALLWRFYAEYSIK